MLDSLVREGLIHYVGVSKMVVWQLTKVLWKSERNRLELVTVTQPYFNAVHREAAADYLDVCVDQYLAVCPYAPREGGFLTGKYARDSSTPPNSRGNLGRGVNSLLRDNGCYSTPFMRWPNSLERYHTGFNPWMIGSIKVLCVPIMGVRSIEQLYENCGVTDLFLSDEQLRPIDEAYEDQ